jgi:predicted lysophospholipase L1 biosynthesis ABC-type transport system permease subunit
VAPDDPLSFVVAAACLLVVTLAASYLPARRAARVDPIEALRADERPAGGARLFVVPAIRSASGSTKAHRASSRQKKRAGEWPAL